jgi:putative zinc finger/helix-turn-helix YgiT family protein
MKPTLCPSCETYIEALCERKRETYNVRGEPTEIEAEVASCPKCGLKVFDEEKDSINLELAYNEYRRKYGLLSPSEIRLIRERYGRSQRALSRLLGWGEITLHRYESGALPDRGHNNMLRMLGEPKNMRTLLQEFTNISPRQRKMLEQRIDHLTASEEWPPFHVSLEHLVSHRYMDSFSGYKEYDLNKFKNAILYLAQRLGGVLKTKLNKLLFYADFLNFKETSV